MTIGSERQLRTQLGAALDELSPGPLPLDSVIRQGRAVVIRRRVIAAAAVIVVAAAAVALPRLAHNLGAPPPTSPYRVTVHPPAKGANKHLIATGTLNKIRWHVTGTAKNGEFDITWYVKGQQGSFGSGSSPLPTSPTTPAEIYSIDGSGPLWISLYTPAGVRSLLVSLSNGQTVNLRPVAVLGPARPRFAAIVLPSYTAITEISAYSVRGELAYAVPFSARATASNSQPNTGPDLSLFNTGPYTDGTIDIARWLKPGQAALPKPAKYKIGQGTADGASWSEFAYVGPWGTCIEAPTGNVYCVASDAAKLAGDKAAQEVYTSYISQQSLGWEVIAAKPSVSYIVAAGPAGRLERVKIYSAGGARLATVATSARNAISGWIAYSATGRQLASGGF